MSRITVLEFLARELEGRILTVASLSAFLAVERAADALNIGATSRHAAQLAVLFPKAPLERISDEFGREIADIVEVLRPKSALSHIAVRLTASPPDFENNRALRDAQIAAAAAETALASPDNREYMALCLNYMAEQESDAERSGFLKSLRGQLPAEPSPDTKPKGSGSAKVLSVSIDVCGSTEAKTAMRACARENQERLERWYEAFHRNFVQLEWTFYRALLDAPASDGGWDWKNTFVVKGIGDEIWLLYEVPENDLWKLGSLSARLLHAALNVARRPIRWTSASVLGDDAKYEAGETRNLPLKFYVDMLDNAFELSGPRRDLLSSRLPQILGSENSWTSTDLIDLGNRLHAGVIMGDERHHVNTIRTDYIGWEVDRFFRATKFALPGVVTVGQTLFEQVADLSTHSDNRVGRTALRETAIACRSLPGGSTRWDSRFRYVEKDISPKDLKGLGEGYTVYRVLRYFDLWGLRHTDADEPIMSDTLQVFTQDMVNAERARQNTIEATQRVRE